MIKLIIQYDYPGNKESFDEHYDNVHVPLVMDMPRLALFEYSKGTVFKNGEESDVYLIAELGFKNQEDMEYSMGSDAGVKALKDLEALTDSPVNTYMINTVECSVSP
tara:strand:- start:228 stop:548 length:321 start_codon:yes stop_codon:yes gene_type:complete